MNDFADDLQASDNQEEIKKDLSSDIDYLEYLSEYDVSSLDSDNMGKMKEIINWVQNEIQSDERNEVLMKLAKIEEELGPVPYGESRISRIRRWIALEDEARNLEKRKRNLLGY